VERRSPWLRSMRAEPEQNINARAGVTALERIVTLIVHVAITRCCCRSFSLPAPLPAQLTDRGASRPLRVLRAFRKPDRLVSVPESLRRPVARSCEPAIGPPLLLPLLAPPRDPPCAPGYCRLHDLGDNRLHRAVAFGSPNA
jgi:hypothetical protein